MQTDDSQSPGPASPSSPPGRPAWYTGATRGQWLALAAALLGWAFDGFEQGIFPLVGRPALVELLGLTDDAHLAATTKGTAQEEAQKRVDAAVGKWMGGITAAFLLGAALGGWLFGWLGDRVGRVRAMALAVFTYALFTGLCGLARGPWQLAGLRLLSALGMGGEWALGVALVMESWPARARPMLAGLIGAAANIGFILTAVPVMLVEGAGTRMDAGGWRLVLGICAFPALLTFFLRLFVPESERWLAVVKAGPRARLIDVFTPALRRRTLIGTTVACIALIGTWGSVQWIPLWVKQMTHDQKMVNYVQMCSGLGAVIGTISAALLAQRLGRRVTYFTLCLGSLLICAYLFRLHFQVSSERGRPVSGGGSADGGFHRFVLRLAAAVPA
jgi:MFS family permease